VLKGLVVYLRLETVGGGLKQGRENGIASGFTNNISVEVGNS
jgi:hypothetical protein